ncbi:universal stress protein [Natronomonas halophila]|uniref:universal stress protein n=1 Tax=Natronomonas halophila TaxID=2747817 RepID=UPI0015B446C7|nr:universal stress protein [Natronomonas halophila]QLD87255.1 universal stress protein [Natronomonas halophila]
MRVVVPYDGSELAKDALEFAVEHHEDADIALVHVLDFVEAGYDAPPEAALPGYWQDWHEEAEKAAEEMFAEAEDLVDVDFETETIVGRPARAIVEYVDETDADAIVMGSHGREGVSRILLGSVAETVVRRAEVPVTVVR